MEFLIDDVSTRSLLMSFVQDNYGLGGTAREGMKSWLCVVWLDVALQPFASFNTPRLTCSSCPKTSWPLFEQHCGSPGQADLLQHLCLLHTRPRPDPNGAWHKLMPV